MFDRLKEICAAWFGITRPPIIFAESIGRELQKDA